jgi:hypothetical protein
MNGEAKLSRCGFVVAKFRADAEALYLMRRSKKWRDISFVGGHENGRDNHKLVRTAHRELLEEVPQLKKMERFELTQLTAEFEHGPVFSLSARQPVRYELQFFLLRCLEAPDSVLQAMTSRSPNILVSEHDMLRSTRYNIAGLVHVLDKAYPGGLNALPFSWEYDLGRSVSELYRAHKAQLELDLDLPASG